MPDGTHARTVEGSSAARHAPTQSHWSTIQRKCACGGTPAADGECEACRKKRELAVQRSALPASPTIQVPASVFAVLRESGEPMGAQVRAFFEPRLGHDFSRVRVHTDAAAAESAAAIDARAYTVGRDVVFGAGRYSPGSQEGRRLLAHELAHVVQQAGSGGRIQAASIGTAPNLSIGPEDDDLERDAEAAAGEVTSGGFATLPGASVLRVQRAPKAKKPAKKPSKAQPPKRSPAIVGLDPAGPEADLTGKTDDSLLACMHGAQTDPLECSPDRPLTWADFSGSRPTGGFSAETTSGVDDKPMDAVKASCLQRILGRTKDETRVFQGLMDSSKSSVRPQFRDPTNTQLTRCTRDVARCTRFFAREARAGRTGGTFSNQGLPARGCPASIAGAPVTAKSIVDCAQFEAECTRTAVAESMRLLDHEQGHFDITCTIARKANAALQAGGDLGPIRTATQKRLTATQRVYDGETAHGCNAGPQATWKTNIANGLPKVSIP